MTVDVYGHLEPAEAPCLLSYNLRHTETIAQTMCYLFLPFLFLLAPLAPLHSAQEPPDPAAIPELRSDAEQGDANAQINLALLYYDGRGVPQDYSMAYVWYNIAAAQGQAKAEKNHDAVAGELDAASLAEAQKLSKEYFKRYVEPFQ